MEKIRVLHIITRLIVGGAQENTMYTAERLNKSRYQVDVISGPQTGSEGSLIEEYRARGINLTILGNLVREIHPIYDLLSIFRLVRHIRVNRYDVVHTHSSKAGILGRIAAKLAGCPIIVHTVHGWSFHRYLPWWENGIYKFLERFTARFTDTIVVVSKYDLDKGLEYKIGCIEQYRLIHSAIPKEDFQPSTSDRYSVRQELGIPNEPPVIGYIGRFSDQKDPLRWVRVAALVKQAVPDCNFIMVGDGPLRYRVNALLHEIGLSDATIMTGIRRDIPRLLSAMDVFLLTSLWEGLPRVIPEAMFMGVPVVASEVDGTAETIQNGLTGYLCNPQDTHCLANRCIVLLIDPNIRNRISTQASDYAHQHFSLDQMINQIDQLYEQLLNKREDRYDS